MTHIRRALFSLFSSEPSDDPGLFLIRKIFYLSLFFIWIVSNGLKDSTQSVSTFHIAGILFLSAMASLLLGSFVGFLFGIPRSLQKENSEKNQEVVVNTNLEQISDWLTKIIVGISLTQFEYIQNTFNKTVTFISFESVSNSVISRPVVFCVIIFYLILGFLYTYLWARTKLYKLLNNINIDEAIRESFNSPNNPISAEINRTQISKLTPKIKKREMESEFASLIVAANPGPIIDYKDLQRGRWGGKAQVNNKLLYVKSHQASQNNSEYFNLRVAVKSLDGAPLIEPVVFMLHDSFDEIAVAGTLIENEAIYDFQSWEAFTIAAICDNGATTLELDLNLVPELPKEYKYI